MKGVPIRLEIGPKDIEQNQCVLVRRDTREKRFVPLDTLESAVAQLLEEIRDSLYRRALENRERRTYTARNMDEVLAIAGDESKTGFIKTMWCEDPACEQRMKDEAGLTSRCMPLEQEHLGDTCVCCGKPAKSMIVWGKAY